MAPTRSRSFAEEREKRLIAVVDGDPANLYYTGMVLQRLDYNILTVRSAEELIEFVNIARPALVLTETVLPGMDGVDLLRTIKRNPATYGIPVVVLTSSRDPAVKDTCIREGCKHVLQKPVEPDVLYAAIQKMTETVPRQYIRLNTCLNVMVGEGREAELSVIEDYITALSEQGMFISTSKPKPVGLQIPLTIFLEKHRISVDGVVLYSFERGKGPLRTAGMGIKFVRIGSEDQVIIKTFIRGEITKGLTMGQIGGTIM
jgi:twitching motility two-component system response regulator PilH